jgi:hypothetical protein
MGLSSVFPRMHLAVMSLSSMSLDSTNQGLKISGKKLCLS